MPPGPGRTRITQVIEVRELTKRYGRTIAVDCLTFAVEPGKVTGFLGANGAGKSSTIRLILGLDRPDSGVALLDGQPYHAWPRPLHRLGALLDARSLHPGRSGRDHLLALAHSHGIPASRVEQVLEQVGLAAPARRRVRTYSLGMAQRLAIAGALLGDPATIMLDEPMNGLDAQGTAWLRGLLREQAADGRAVLISSHVMSEMTQLAEHVVVIGAGRLLADATLTDFVAGHDSLEAAFLARTTVIDAPGRT